MLEHYAMAIELRILLGMGAKLAGRDLEQRLLAHGLPITSLQHGMLRLLKRQSYTISELSRKMTLTPATLVPAVDALERHGLVARGHDPSDRRRTPLQLTQAGADILARIPPVDDTDIVVSSLLALSPEEQRSLLTLLRRLVGSMAQDQEIVRALGATIRQME
jgi:DNA-binding MarR family transcriptional regulator